MSGDNYYFGDNVNMRGGRDNIGMVKNQVAPANAPAPSSALLSAIEELRRLMEELRAQVPPASARAIDDSLPDIAADAEPQQRHRALMAVAGIAATVGAVGVPVVEVVNRILEMIGTQ
ncbi:hypothetical protein ACFY0A_32180 [Streptomyces sp. NPDC001698]|uniref:hypothetical protein n=1 Tax=Streptomyces sp. NPDC001698 TaxID=3364601 RepID=UPI0036A6942E